MHPIRVIAYILYPKYMYYLLPQKEDQSDASDDDSEEGEDEAMEEGGEVDQNFRIELMKVLQNQGAVVGVL